MVDRKLLNHLITQVEDRVESIIFHDLDGEWEYPFLSQKELQAASMSPPDGEALRRIKTAGEWIKEHPDYGKAEIFAKIKEAGITLETGEPGAPPTYFTQEDKIVLPPASAFFNQNNYMAAIYHELGHWSGHPSRLNFFAHLKAAADRTDAMSAMAMHLIAAVGIEAILDIDAVMETTARYCFYNPEEMVVEMASLYHLKKADLLTPEILLNAASYMAGMMKFPGGGFLRVSMLREGLMNHLLTESIEMVESL